MVAQIVENHKILPHLWQPWRKRTTYPTFLSSPPHSLNFAFSCPHCISPSTSIPPPPGYHPSFTHRLTCFHTILTLFPTGPPKILPCPVGSSITTQFLAHCLLIALMMVAASTSETMVKFCQISRRDIPEYSDVHAWRRENLKSYQKKHVRNIIATVFFNNFERMYLDLFITLHYLTALFRITEVLMSKRVINCG
jgi:hypothetical protein